MLSFNMVVDTTKERNCLTILYVGSQKRLIVLTGTIGPTVLKVNVIAILRMLLSYINIFW